MTEENTLSSSGAMGSLGASYPVSHIEWEVPNGEASAAFLTALFTWDFKRFSDHYWLCERQGEAALGLLEKPAPNVLLGACPVFIDVSNIEQCLAKAVALGAVLIEPKTELPNYGAWAKIKEPGGNTIGLFERH